MAVDAKALAAAVDALEASGGNEVHASNALGIPRGTLQARLNIIQRTPDTPLAKRLQKVRAQPTVETDRVVKQQAQQTSSLKKRYDEALKVIQKQQDALDAVGALKNTVETYDIQPTHASGTSESTCVWVASDWHIEERVGKEVGGLNKFNLAIAEQRVAKFFQSGLRLTNLLAKDTKIGTIVLALLGDFISNQIHEEFAENNELLPIDAILKAQSMIASGIEFILTHFKGKLVIPCHSGNHARTTKTTHYSTENGHSLEYFMYRNLAQYFKSEPRVTWIIPDGYHSYVDIYNLTLRFHHGHSIRYQGGVGGIFIPAFKAISQWSKAKPADLDVFGHFHQSKDGGNFLSNGSLIGFNGFALAIKADFEPPKQNLFLIEKTRGRTCTWPVLLE